MPARWPLIGRDRLAPGATSLDAFADFRDWYRAREDEAHAFLMSFDEADVLRFSQRPEHRARSSQSRVFLLHQRSEYPTHRMLQELMQLEASGADKERVIQIATLLLPWCREWQLRPAVRRGIEHFAHRKNRSLRAGLHPESAKELKSAAGFLITNYTRQHIITMPRALRKRNVYEEVARFLDIPEARKL